MYAYLISYDLNKPRTDGIYNRMRDTIVGGFPVNKKLLKSLWIIVTDLDSETICRILTEEVEGVDDTDKIVVIRVCRDSTRYGLTDQQNDWLDENLPYCG